MIVLLLLLQIEWQSMNRPYSNTEQEIIIYYSIPVTKLHRFYVSDMLYVEYETQLTVFDSKNNQLDGDFWERRVLADTTDIKDSVSMIIDKASAHYELRIVDLKGGTILMGSDKIIPIKYLGNILWDFQDDTVTVTFMVLNDEGNIDSMVARIDDNRAFTGIRTGTYEDTIVFDVTNLPNDSYTMKIDMYYRSIKVDGLNIPMVIARAFYLDEMTWSEKVEQLEYIATSSEMKVLRDAMVVERESLWQEFWKQHDPTPNTEYNEREVEYFERIAYCKEYFIHGDRGWRSDRAKIYVKYGPPDEIQSYPYHLGPPKSVENPAPTLYDSYIVWLFYRLNREYVFGDKHGLGEYILISSKW